MCDACEFFADGGNEDKQLQQQVDELWWVFLAIAVGSLILAGCFFLALTYFVPQA